MKEKVSQFAAIEKLRLLLNESFRVERLQDKIEGEVLVLTKGWEGKDYLTSSGKVVKEVGERFFRAEWPVVKEESIALADRRILLGVIDFKAGVNGRAFEQGQWVLVRPERGINESGKLLEIDKVQWYGAGNDDAVSPSFPWNIETKDLLDQNGPSLGQGNDISPERIAFVVAVF